MKNPEHYRTFVPLVLLAICTGVLMGVGLFMVWALVLSEVR